MAALHEELYTVVMRPSALTLDLEGAKREELACELPMLVLRGTTEAPRTCVICRQPSCSAPPLPTSSVSSKSSERKLFDIFFD